MNESCHKSISLGDIFKVSSGGTPSRKKSEYFNGDIPWVKTGDLKGVYANQPTEFITQLGLDNSSAKLFPPSTVLLAMYGATIGACSILSFEAATNQACAAILPNENYNEKYLYYYFCYIKPSLVRLGVGGAQPNISAGLIKKLKIPNLVLEEQKKIAEILDAADSLRQKDKQLVEHYDRLSQSLFLDMFGDPVTNPKNWEKVDFASIGTLERGKSKHRPRNDPALLGGEYPLIQTGDVANSNGYLTTYKSTYSELGLKQSKIWSAGTLCITIAANIAKTGILTFDACFPDSVVGFINNDKSNIEYVKFWMGFLQKTLEDSAPMAAQKNINLKILRELEVPLPSIDLQNLFGERLIKIEKQKTLAQQALKKSEDLFNSLLQQVFKGELTNS